MTHKRKRLGRPPGSKNKKNKNLDNIIKNEGDSDECTHVCTFCSISFKTNLSLEDHLKTCRKTVLDGVDVLKPTYNCKQCPKKFRFKKNYTNHLKNAHSKTQGSLWVCPDVVKPTYNCKQCSKKFQFKKSYTTHLQNEHSKTPGSIECSQCSVKCPNEEVLSKHIKNVHEREIFECEHCEKKFVRRSHVLRHLLQRGCDGRNIVVHPCEICSASFTRRDNLVVHLRTQHLSNEFFNCKFCDFHTKNFSKLIIHNITNHTETPHFECDHCGKVTSSRGAMAKHLEIHGDKKFSCDVCGYSTFTIEVMRRHVFTHSTEKPYKCKFCDNSYIQKVQLQRHLQKHTGNQCSICKETFTSKADLLIHTKEHMGVIKLLCPIDGCSYGKAEFENEKALQRHVTMHLDDKPHQCEVCSKRFHSEMNMRRHMSTHALERPRRCMYCVAARAYVRGEQLVRHVRKAHPHVFRERLMHVRQVLGANLRTERVKKSELESILNVLDAESDRILEGYGSGVLYGGLQEQFDVEDEEIEVEINSPLMCEEELIDNIGKLLSQLIDKDMLECFGWPDASVDEVLEKVIENCGAQPADKEKWTRVQCLRENAKHLFLYVIEDKNIAKMLDSHTIDQVITHILAQVCKSNDDDNDDDDNDDDNDDDDDDNDGDNEDNKGNIKIK